MDEKLLRPNEPPDAALASDSLNVPSNNIEGASFGIPETALQPESLAVREEGAAPAVTGTGS